MDKVLEGDAIDRIAALAKDANGFTIEKIDTAGLGDGVPSSVPAGFDHRSNGHGLTELASMIEKFRLYPARRKGTANVTTVQALMDLVNRHKSEHSAIFATTSLPKPSFTAVIDYHELVNAEEDKPAVSDKPKPAFCQHKIHYAFPLSEEFVAWSGSDGKGMTQGVFAAFIEEHIADLSQAGTEEVRQYGDLFGTTMATPADMLALSRGLEINVAGKVKQNVRLQSGEGELVFTEEHQDSTGQKITVPGLFMVCIPIFLDGAPVRLPARLRYRVSSGEITWFYQLYKWKELVRERVVMDLEDVKEATHLPTYEGSPEA